jgi:hypothetical protein
VNAVISGQTVMMSRNHADTFVLNLLLISHVHPEWLR